MSFYNNCVKLCNVMTLENSLKKFFLILAYNKTLFETHMGVISSHCVCVNNLEIAHI